MTLLERLLKQNPWWQNQKLEEIKPYKKRFLFKEIEKYFNTPQILAILGLRRTGKSVLLFQIIKELLVKIPPKKIMYFSFDEILGKDPEIIEKILQIYENEVLKEELKDTYVFFDEINHIENWQIILKRYYDLNRRIKFFISGSSSIYLRKTKESLAGRIYEFTLSPLSFKEYLYLKGIKLDDISLKRLILKKELNKYFISGSFPEVINEFDFFKVQKYINSIIDKIIFYDIPKVYEVNEPEVLKMILSFIAQKPGMTLEYNNLASNLKMTYQTISKYVEYLEKAFLIRLVYNFRGSPVARARKLKKAYLSSVNLAVGFLNSEEEFLKNLPLLAENLVCLHLNAQWFWKKYTELDFYSNKTPVEVKYGETQPDIKNNLLAVKTLKADKLLVITKDQEIKYRHKNIEIVNSPLWRFLLEENVYPFM